MNGLNHLVHACVIVVLAYVVMLYVLKQKPSVAESRSIALGAVAFAYMLVFGHKMPSF